MPHLDLNIYSRAIEMIRAERRHQLRKTSCNDIKLSRLYNTNVDNTLPIHWYCERQTESRTTSFYNTNLGQSYSYAIPSIYLPASSIYCRLNKGASSVNKTFIFYKNIYLFKSFVTFNLFQFSFLCVCFHQYHAQFSLLYRQKIALIRHIHRYKCRRTVYISV